MNVTDIIRRAGRSLRQAKMRTLLTSLAIGVGAFTITLSLAGGQGGREYADAIVSANTDVKEILVNKESEDTEVVPRYEEGEGGRPSQLPPGPFADGVEFLNLADLDGMATIGNVEDVTPNYQPGVDFITVNGEDKFQATVTTFSPTVSLEYAAGNVNGDLTRDEIVITEEYAEALGFSPASEAVGQQVNIGATRQQTVFPGSVPERTTFPLTIRAVSSESGLAFRSQSSLLVSSERIKELYDYVNEGTPGYNRFLVASVVVNDVENVPAVQQALEDKGYTAQTSEDVLGTVNTFINVLLGILLGFGTLAVITSVFGIINTMYISVLERTQQIGLMKALGMSQRDVGALFTFEAAWIGFLGGAIGAGLAVIGGTIANPFISEALGLDDIFLLIFEPLQVFAVIAGLIFISIMAGIVPARKASKLDPIEALRTE